MQVQVLCTSLAMTGGDGRAGLEEAEETSLTTTAAVSLLTEEEPFLAGAHGIRFHRTVLGIEFVASASTTPTLQTRSRRRIPKTAF